MNGNLEAIYNALNLACAESEKYIGATAPNPTVGAAALDRQGIVISVAAHQKAGTMHAEARLIDDLITLNRMKDAVSMVITLEPCSHWGKTPPCVDVILKHPQIRQVIYGKKDIFPIVNGSGHARLEQAGLQVFNLEEIKNVPDQLKRRLDRLVEPFFHRTKTGLPFVVVKQAIDRQGSMIPPAGHKTFTSKESIRYAHQLRKESQAIITGSGTVLADHPLFSVREVTDHPDISRVLVILDRQGRVPASEVTRFQSLGFEVWIEKGYRETLKKLSNHGVMQVLVEAGPSLTQFVLSEGYWNENVIISQAQKEGEPDLIQVKQNPCFQESSNEKH